MLNQGGVAKSVLIVVKLDVVYTCIDTRALGRTGNVPTLDTMEAPEIELKVGGRDCQSEQGNIPLFHTFGPGLEEAH